VCLFVCLFRGCCVIAGVADFDKCGANACNATCGVAVRYVVACFGGAEEARRSSRKKKTLHRNIAMLKAVGPPSKEKAKKKPLFKRARQVV